MEKIIIPGMEMHITHACNLNCEFCAHFSNFNIGGNISLEEADEWMRAWNQRIQPNRFTLLGGEPTLNPEICNYLILARKNWPKSKIHLVSNGILLHRYPDIPKIMNEISPSRLVVSRHHNSKTYMSKFEEITSLLRRWQKQWGIEVEIEQGIQHWRKPYQYENRNILPYQDGDFKKSFQACKMKNQCRNLFNHKLFKCAPITYLSLLKKSTLGKEWQFYLNYKPLEPNCTNEELKKWINLEAIPECGMCSIKYEYININNPLDRIKLL